MLEEIFSSQSDQDHILKKKKKRPTYFPGQQHIFVMDLFFFLTFTTLISVIRVVILGELSENRFN